MKEEEAEECGGGGRGKDVLREELSVGCLEQCAHRKAAGGTAEVPKEGWELLALSCPLPCPGSAPWSQELFWQPKCQV